MSSRMNLMQRFPAGSMILISLVIMAAAALPALAEQPQASDERDARLERTPTRSVVDFQTPLSRGAGV